MPAERCFSCRKFISSIDSVKCNNCSIIQHRSCAALPAKVAVSPTWRCHECRKIESKSNMHHTSDGFQQTADAGLQISGETLQSSPSGSKESTDVSNRTILDEIKLMRLDFMLICKEISEIKVEVQSCFKRLDGLEARIDVLENRTSVLNEVPSDINKVILQLKSDLNDRDQELLANDIEVRNVPEEQGENPSTLIASIAEKLGVALDIRDIVNVERVGSRSLNATNSEGATVSRPRALVVRLARRDLRDELLRSARVRRTTSDIGFAGKPQRFYVNERLTKTNRLLFRLARNTGRHNGWQYIWTSRGKILARRKSGEPVVKIRCENDIVENIGPITDVL